MVSDCLAFFGALALLIAAAMAWLFADELLALAIKMVWGACRLVVQLMVSGFRVVCGQRHQPTAEDPLHHA